MTGPRRKRYPSEYGPRKRSEARAKSVHVRMSAQQLELLQRAAARLDLSLNEVALAELGRLFAWEADNDRPR